MSGLVSGVSLVVLVRVRWLVSVSGIFLVNWNNWFDYGLDNRLVSGVSLVSMLVLVRVRWLVSVSRIWLVNWVGWFHNRLVNLVCWLSGLVGGGWVSRFISIGMMSGICSSFLNRMEELVKEMRIVLFSGVIVSVMLLGITFVNGVRSCCRANDCSNSKES